MFVVYYKKSKFSHTELQNHQNINKVEYKDCYKDLEVRSGEDYTRIDLVTVRNTNFNRKIGKLKEIS